MSATFHGRDVFAPVAARLAAGEELQAAGEPFETDDLVKLVLSQARIESDALVAHVLGVDGYGNVLLDATHDLARTTLRLGAVAIGERSGTFAATFADVPTGELVLYEDASRRLAIAINSGDAAAELQVQPGDEISIRSS